MARDSLGFLVQPAGWSEVDAVTAASRLEPAQLSKTGSASNLTAMHSAAHSNPSSNNSNSNTMPAAWQAVAAWLPPLTGADTYTAASSLTSQQQAKIKALVRQHCGAPQQLRPALWLIASGGRALSQQPDAESYHDLLTLLTSSTASSTGNVLPAHVIAQVELDARTVGLTWRHHALFKTPDGVACIARVALALLLHNPRLTYTRPLVHMVAFTLVVCGGVGGEEACFWILAALLRTRLFGHYGGQWLLGVRVEQEVLRRLVARKLPRLTSHLAALDLPLHALTQPWLGSLFVSQLPPETLARVWDATCVEGPKVQLRVALALLKAHESVLLSCSSPELLRRLLELKVTRHALAHDPPALLHAAFHQCGPMPGSQLEAMRQDVLRNGGVAAAGGALDATSGGGSRSSPATPAPGAAAAGVGGRGGGAMGGLLASSSSFSSLLSLAGRGSVSDKGAVPSAASGVKSGTASPARTTPTGAAAAVAAGVAPPHTSWMRSAVGGLGFKHRSSSTNNLALAAAAATPAAPAAPGAAAAAAPRLASRFSEGVTRSSAGGMLMTPPPPPSSSSHAAQASKPPLHSTSVPLHRTSLPHPHPASLPSSGGSATGTVSVPSSSLSLSAPANSLLSGPVTAPMRVSDSKGVVEVGSAGLEGSRGVGSAARGGVVSAPVSPSSVSALREVQERLEEEEEEDVVVTLEQGAVQQQQEVQLSPPARTSSPKLKAAAQQLLGALVSRVRSAGSSSSGRDTTRTRSPSPSSPPPAAPAAAHVRGSQRDATRASAELAAC